LREGGGEDVAVGGDAAGADAAQKGTPASCAGMEPEAMGEEPTKSMSLKYEAMGEEAMGEGGEEARVANAAASRALKEEEEVILTPFLGCRG